MGWIKRAKYRREQERTHRVREAAALEVCLRQQEELAEQFGTEPTRIPELRDVRFSDAPERR
jgi:hypothetical protein